MIRFSLFTISMLSMIYSKGSNLDLFVKEFVPESQHNDFIHYYKKVIRKRSFNIEKIHECGVNAIRVRYPGLASEYCADDSLVTYMGFYEKFRQVNASRYSGTAHQCMAFMRKTKKSLSNFFRICPSKK